MSLAGEESKLNTIPSATLPTLPREFAAQHSGIDFPDPHDAPHRVEMTKNELVPQSTLPLSLTLVGELWSLTGLSQAIKIVRDTILATDTISDHYDPDRRGLPEKRNIMIDADEKLRLLTLKQKTLHEYVSAQVRIKIIRSALTQLPESINSEYTAISQQLETLEEILTDITQNLELTQSSQKLALLVEDEWEKQSKNDKEIDRVKKLLSGERANRTDTEDTQPAQRLRQRVLQALLSKMDMQATKAVEEKLIEELLTTATTINDIRVQSRIRRAHEFGRDTYSAYPEFIHPRIKKIKNEHDKKVKSVETLNKELIDIIVGVANILPKLFPHTDDQSPTLLSSVLYRGEAVCAGKAEILANFFRNMGLKTNVILALQTMDGKKDHAICEISLFGGVKLHVDANYLNKKIGNTTTKDSGIGLSGNSNQLEMRFQANRNFIIPTSDVLLYTLKPTSKPVARNDRNICTLLNQDGTRTQYETSVPFPHPLVSRQLPNNLNAATLSNAGMQFITDWNSKRADSNTMESIKLLEMALQRDKYNSGTARVLAELYCTHGAQLGMSKDTTVQLALETVKKPMKDHPDISEFRVSYIFFLLRNYTFLGYENQQVFNEVVQQWEEIVKYEHGLIRSKYLYDFALYLSAFLTQKFYLKPRVNKLLEEAYSIAVSDEQKKQIYSLIVKVHNK